MSNDNTVTVIAPHHHFPLGADVEMMLEWEAWRTMALAITDAGADFNENEDLSKIIAAWGFRYMNLRNAYEDNAPPLFYSPESEQRIKKKYLTDE